MKTIIKLMAFLILSSCTAKSKEQFIRGEWKMTSWVNTQNKVDFLEHPDAPKFNIIFKKDTVYPSEIDSNKTHIYKYDWSIRNDSLYVGSLGTFNIKELDEDQCTLEILTRNVFTHEKELHLEILSLIKK